MGKAPAASTTFEAMAGKPFAIAYQSSAQMMASTLSEVDALMLTFVHTLGLTVILCHCLDCAIQRLAAKIAPEKRTTARINSQNPDIDGTGLGGGGGGSGA